MQTPTIQEANIIARLAEEAPARPAPGHARAIEHSACPAMCCWRSGGVNDFGRYQLPKNAVQCSPRPITASQGLLPAGVPARPRCWRRPCQACGDARSWAAPWAHQFLPSEFYKYAVDFDHDGRRDIWNSVPVRSPRLPSSYSTRAQRPGLRWAGVRAQGVDTQAVPELQPVSAWLKAAMCPPTGARRAPPSSRRRPHCCCQGLGGLLTLRNYYVIKGVSRSLRPVRRPSEQAHHDPRPFETPWAGRAIAHQQVEPCSARSPKWASEARSTAARPAALPRHSAPIRSRTASRPMLATAALLAHMQARRRSMSWFALLIAGGCAWGLSLGFKPRRGAEIAPCSHTIAGSLPPPVWLAG